MEDNGKKISAERVLNALRGIISSNWFPFVTAAFTLLCYYAAWDMVIIWYMALCGAFLLIFCRDTSPLITLFLFMNIMISMKNSPTQAGGNPSDYYSQTVHLVQIIVAIALFAGAGVFRLAAAIKKGQFRCSPTFFGLCAFAAGIMFNGLAVNGYSAMSALYGFFMAFLFLGIFSICSCSVGTGRDAFSRIAWSFVALAICMVIELAVAYVTYDDLLAQILSGHRADSLYFGWGIHNTMGMLLVISLPSAAYLAVNSGKASWVFTVCLVLFTAAAFLTMSRQAMVCGAVMFVICAVWILVKAPKKIVNGCIFGAMLIAAATVVIIKRDLFLSLLGALTDNFFSGSGRIQLYITAVQNFLRYPLFGTGFFCGDLEGDPGFVGVSVVPEMYHNTILELAAVGGVFALVPYVIHRVHTVISFIKNPSRDRLFIALTILGLLLVSLLDNHIFYILPTLVYSYLVAVLVRSEKPEREGEEPSPTDSPQGPFAE